MKINEMPADIARIDMTFDGYTGGSSAASHRIYVLTAGADWTQTVSWTQVGSDQGISPGTYTSMTRSITSGFGNYIDAAGKITWAVYETTSSEMMHINYLRMSVVYASVNILPEVSVTLPVTDSVFSQNANVTIQADASDADGSIARVEFYQGTTKLGEDMTAPYSYIWNNVPTGNYSLIAVATDNDAGTTTSAAVNITVLGAEGTGAVLCERWTGIAGTAVTDLTSSINYPEYPDEKELLVSLQGPANWGDNYGTRIRGYLNPSTGGDYTFTLASDADSQFWLSSDQTQANAQLIASIPAVPQSPAITLAAGQKYYIEVLHKEGTGDDSLSVFWQGAGLPQQVIDGIYLSPCCLDLEIYADFAGQWNRTDCDSANTWCSGADRNRDGSVLLEDLLTFTDAWLLGI
jgi:hypothetical protein